MKIAIDISQIAYEGTGVASYTRDLVTELVKKDKKNDYLLFGYSLRNKHLIDKFLSHIKNFNSRLQVRSFPIPPSLADFIWNEKHIFPLERLLGSFDIYHSSDWIQIPSKAKKITTVHDLVVYKYPRTSHPQIIKTQKRRLDLVKKECRLIIADSLSTKNDLSSILKIPQSKIKVVYPGINDIFKKIGKRVILDVLTKYQIKRPYFLTVGTNDPRKNLKRIINAFNKLNKRSQLVIISSRGWGETIRGGENIKIVGNVEIQDMPALYSGALSLAMRLKK